MAWLWYGVGEVEKKKEKDWKAYELDNIKRTWYLEEATSTERFILKECTHG